MKVLDPVSTVLRQKGSTIYAVPPDASVFSAIELMADKQIGALLVIDEGRLVGMVSERDYARKVVLNGRSSKDTFVREIMTSDPITINCESSVDEAMRTMTDTRCRHLPVIDPQGHVAGIVSIGDLVNWIVTSQDAAIAHLEHYISGDICT
jgi:CBS domain-containing protein